MSKAFEGVVTPSVRHSEGRTVRRHSSFWIGLYGQSLVTATEFSQDLVAELISIRTNKRPFLPKGIRAMNLILSTL